MNCDNVGFGQRPARRAHPAMCRTTSIGARHEQLDRVRREAIQSMQSSARATGDHAASVEIGKTCCDGSLKSCARSSHCEGTRPKPGDQSRTFPLPATRRVDSMLEQLSCRDHTVLRGGERRNAPKSVVHRRSVRDGCDSEARSGHPHACEPSRAPRWSPQDHFAAPVDRRLPFGARLAGGGYWGGGDHAAGDEHRGGADAGDVASADAVDLEDERGAADDLDRRYP